MYVCLCKGLTETDVRHLVRDRELGPDGLISELGLDDDDCCGRCARNVHELMAVATGKCSSPCLLRRLSKNS